MLKFTDIAASKYSLRILLGCLPLLVGTHDRRLVWFSSVFASNTSPTVLTHQTNCGKPPRYRWLTRPDKMPFLRSSFASSNGITRCKSQRDLVGRGLTWSKP